MFTNKEQEPVLLTYFPGNGAQVDGVNQLGMLKAQLIAPLIKQYIQAKFTKLPKIF